MRLFSLPLGAAIAVSATLGVAAPAFAASTIADGLWTDGATWDGGSPPDQSANGGLGEEVFLNNNVTVPAGVDYVNNNSVDPVTGDPLDVDGDLLGDFLWMSFADVPGGVTLTVQDGARVGTQFFTQIIDGPNPKTINIESGGEYVTPGVDNGGSSFVANVAPGGVLTFDASQQPGFPDPGFFRGNVFAGAGASTVFNIEGRLDVIRVDNSNANIDDLGTIEYNLINGGVINYLPFGGQAFGLNSTPAPDTNGIDPNAINVTGTGRVVNTFGPAFDAYVGAVPAGLTVDVADGSILDSSGANADEWSAFVTANGGDPATIPGPRRAFIRSDGLSGSGKIQLDVHGIELAEDGTIVDVYHDDFGNGSNNSSDNSFSGEFLLNYVGGEITDEIVTAINTENPALLLINGATNNSPYDQLEGLEVPDALWSDGNRDFQVEFTPIFFPELGFPFPDGFTNPQLVLTAIESITLIDSALDGDFNDDGVVDAADYTIWRDNEGGDESLLPVGSGDGSGVVDQGDYDLWAGNFGAVAAASSATPEPTSLVTLLLALLSASRSRRG